MFARPSHLFKNKLNQRAVMTSQRRAFMSTYFPAHTSAEHKLVGKAGR